MPKDMKILCVVVLAGLSVACFAEPPAEPNPIEESLNVVAGIAGGFECGGQTVAFDTGTYAYSG